MTEELILMYLTPLTVCRWLLEDFWPDWIIGVAGLFCVALAWWLELSELMVFGLTIFGCVFLVFCFFASMILLREALDVRKERQRQNEERKRQAEHRLQNLDYRSRRT
jgi:hypothetical protein